MSLLLLLKNHEDGAAPVVTPTINAGGKHKHRPIPVDPRSFRHIGSLALSSVSLPGLRWRAESYAPPLPTDILGAPGLPIADLQPVVRGRRAVRRNKARLALGFAPMVFRMTADVTDSEAETAIRMLLTAAGWFDG